MEGYAAASNQAQSTRVILGSPGAISAPRPVNPSCFGNIEDVSGMCATVASRVEKMVNRMIGDPPPSPEATGIAPGAVGLFGIADLHAREVRESMKRILTALDRLETSLP